MQINQLGKLAPAIVTIGSHPLSAMTGKQALSHLSRGQGEDRLFTS